MTVGVAVRARDGIVLASDSLTTFGRGAPVARHTNKVYVINHKDLEHPVALAGAGMTAFIDKFVDRANRTGIEAARKNPKVDRTLDVVDFVEHVCEPLVAILMKEYLIDRNRFFGSQMSEYSLGMLVAGATKDKEMRAYTIHEDGLSEFISGYGTIGSGAAYAELFLHGFVPEPSKTSINDAVRLVSYAIKGVEIMDPNVGGDTKVCVLKFEKDKLVVKELKNSDLPRHAKEKMEAVLSKIGKDMRSLVGR